MKPLSISMTQRESTYGWAYFALQVLVVPSILQYIGLWLGLGNITLNLAGFGLNFVVVVVLFHRFLFQNLRSAAVSPLRFVLVVFGSFLLYQFLTLLVNILISSTSDAFANANNDNISQMAKQQYLPMFVGTVILVPVAEEALYRGLLFSRLLPKSKVLAYTVSILGFALAHVLGYVGQVSALNFFLSFMQYLPAGICLCLAYQAADSIWAPITVHMTANLIGMLALR